MSTNRQIVWMCGACGRVGPTRDTVGDSSCRTWAVEVYEDSINYVDINRGNSAIAVSRKD